MRLIAIAHPLLDTSEEPTTEQRSALAGRRRSAPNALRIIGA